MEFRRVLFRSQPARPGSSAQERRHRAASEHHVPEQARSLPPPPVYGVLAVCRRQRDLEGSNRLFCGFVGPPWHTLIPWRTVAGSNGLKTSGTPIQEIGKETCRERV